MTIESPTSSEGDSIRFHLRIFICRYNVELQLFSLHLADDNVETNEISNLISRELILPMVSNKFSELN